MTDRTIFDLTRSRLQAPPKPVNQTGAQLLDIVSKAMGKMGLEQMQEWQAATIKQAEKEGETSGASGDPVKYRDPGKLSGEAFNKSAVRTSMDRLEIESQTKMAALSEEFKDDPQAYQAASADYIKGIDRQLGKSSETANIGKLFVAKLKLTAQGTGYGISNTYMELQKNLAKVNNIELIHTIKANTYRQAGSVFSADPVEKGLALENFALNKKMLDTSLHQVLPDGTPAYTALEIQAKQDDFHKTFYVRAVQNWASETELSDSDMLKLNDGTLSIDIPGVGSINILDQIGMEDYEKNVRDYTYTKIKERNAAAKAARKTEKDIAKEAQRINGFELIGGIRTGVPTTINAINEGVRLGKYTSADGKSALKLLLGGTVNSKTTAADLNIRIINGEDVGDEIKKSANMLSDANFSQLSADNAKGIVGDYDENRRWIFKEGIQKDEYGNDDPKSLRLAFDIAKRYDRMMDEGMDPGLAYEKAREAIDLVKTNTSKRLYNSFPTYAIKGDGNKYATDKIDPDKTYEATKQALQDGLITNTQYKIEVERLKLIKFKLDKLEE